MPNRLLKLFLLLCASAALTACSLNPIKPYRMEIQQGNFFTQDQVDKLKLGMTKEQVRFVLGTPLLTDVFHADRWDYVYRRQKARSNDLEERRLTLHFERNQLKEIEGGALPEEAAK
ncbi:MAG TPA: outer membrane protein assembly factor BamE [Burkholderiales bacterium]|nr:outer membrane protein assembly factor BamE [Burkholderiales bacterium]